MESSTSLPETLRRLDELITERGLKRADIFDVQTLAAKTALPDTVIKRLVKGGKPTPDSVSDRVCARMKVVSAAYLADNGKRASDLAADLRDSLGISDVWARSVCEGKKMPNVDLLHHLAAYFRVEGGERFFTAPADEALNRVLLPTLRELEGSDTDPLSLLMREYGVESAHMRQDGDLTREQVERVLKGVLQSVLPQKGESGA
ncbi:hypothetical protein OG588_29885 [Streptomyces prunicolor]|uniref:hypothetical protein n=1 Tax=Streptomyces prunicolor TaxID=67348 RepID=UPI003866783F|nr:hypothetical protein OG588_29885 [Streptomyces prunicolor]